MEAHELHFPGIGERARLLAVPKPLEPLAVRSSAVSAYAEVALDAFHPATFAVTAPPVTVGLGGKGAGATGAGVFGAGAFCVAGNAGIGPAAAAAVVDGFGGPALAFTLRLAPVFFGLGAAIVPSPGMGTAFGS